MDVAIEAIVTEVTVYPDRARVVCEGSCELIEGSQMLIIGELPLALDPESVRAQGAGTARVRLRSVDVVRRNYAVAPSGRVQELESALEERTTALQAVADAHAGSEAALAHLAGMRGETEQFARALAKGQSTVEDQARLMDFIQEQDQTLRHQMRELDSQARDIQREIDRLSAELDQLRSARPRQRQEVRLDVDVLKAGTFAVEISYIVSQAGWQPLYDIHFWGPETGKAADPALQVTYLAQISQNTGQAWEGVRLAVSTARPALNQRLPELRPWFVDEYQPPQPRVYASRSMAKSADMEGVMADAVPMPAAAPEQFAAEVAVAEARSEGTAVTFALGGEVDVPADGTPQKTVIGEFSLTPKLDYFCAPRHTDAVFRRATMTNSGPGPLLSGRANLFDGEEYIGSNSLAYTPVNGELELMLGVEERIEVKRELMRRDVDKRLLRDVRQIGYSYEITLRNGLPSAALIVLQDQYPNSRHEQIKVKLESAVPTPESQSDLHIIEWRVTIPAESEKKIQYSYVIEHPRDMRVSGLAD